MTDSTKPLMHAYIRAHLLITDTELSGIKKDLAGFAAAEGYALGTVYIEQVESVPAAFQALVDAVRRDDAKAVAVPSLHHFSVVGAPDAMKQHLEHYTNARVLVARYAS